MRSLRRFGPFANGLILVAAVLSARAAYAIPDPPGFVPGRDVIVDDREAHSPPGGGTFEATGRVDTGDVQWGLTPWECIVVPDAQGRYWIPIQMICTPNIWGSASCDGSSAYRFHYFGERGSWSASFGTGGTAHYSRGAWLPNLPVDGCYRVMPWIWWNSTGSAVYHIVECDGKTPPSVPIAQFAGDHCTPRGEWVDLGVYRFKAGGNGGHVWLDNQTGTPGECVLWDAVAFVRVADPGGVLIHTVSQTATQCEPNPAVHIGGRQVEVHEGGCDGPVIGAITTNADGTFY